MDKDSKTKTIDTYLGLCTEVYELSKPDAPSAAFAFYREYAKAANGPILEPMCGTEPKGSASIDFFPVLNQWMLASLLQANNFKTLAILGGA